MCFAMAQAGYKKDSEVRRKRNFLLFLVTYIYSLFYTHLLDMHVYAKNGFIDKVWALFMGHTVPYTFVFKPQIYVLDLPLSYGHSYLYALCMQVINSKYK